MSEAEYDDHAAPQRWSKATVYADMWADPDDDPREALDWGTGEKANLAAYLDRYRMTLELKCDGLDAEQLARRSVPPSTMSLLGLLRHMASVEQGWFRRAIEGFHDIPRLFKTEEDRDADFNGAAADDDVVAEAWRLWRSEVAHAREVFAGVDDLGAQVPVHGDPTAIRDIIVHMIEEYARHCGHADLLRERIDGRVGQ